VEGRIINNKHAITGLEKRPTSADPDEEVTLETRRDSIISRIVRPMPLMEALRVPGRSVADEALMHRPTSTSLSCK